MWDPINKKDPTGKYTGWDDAAFMAAGAVLGVGGLAVADLAAGKLSDWQEYGGAAIGGAVGGEAALYTLASGPGAIMAAGAAAGAAQNLATAGLYQLSGDETKSQTTLAKLPKDAIYGAATAAIPAARVAGVTSGSNSFLALAKQMTTKLRSGQIGSVSAATVGKMALGASGAAAPGVALAAGQNALERRNEPAAASPASAPAQMRSCFGRLGCD